ncbi:MAG: hypothetical protein NTV49_02005 [Kiritimatiellaeota bacterium]|nr:hypothetical protein [Kiritimatiellota bacterium]
MKKTCGVVLLMAFCALWLTPTGRAADVASSNETAAVSQAELAKLLVEVLGLARFLPADPTPAQNFAILMVNNIAPQDGWDAGRAVTRADLARVIVQALKKSGEIKTPDDPQAWIDYLVGIGVPIDTVGLATKPLEPLVLPVAPKAYTALVDPLHKEIKQVMGPITQFGADMTPIRELFAFKPLPPQPVTPTGPQGARF